MPVKLIAFDLDGTAIINHKDLPPENRAAFEEAAARGVELVPASGRMKGFLPESITSLPGVRYVITANGAGVYDLQTGQAVWRCLIPNEKALQVQALLDEYDLFVEYYKDGRAITRQGDPERAFSHFGIPESKRTFLTKDYILAPDMGEMLRQTGLTPEKINLTYLPTPQLRQEVRERLEALGGLKLTSSIPDNLEINAAGAHKGAALEVLAGKLGIPQESVMALGDNGNDVTMLEYAGVSVCMVDGSPEAKAAAKYITGPHDQGGLAQAVRLFVLDC
ncbi:MAG: Cof-type HAD-IIB family hydrolase [Acutalibacter sp.]